MNIFELNPGLAAALSGAPTLWMGSQESFDGVAEAQRQVALLTPEKMAQLQVRAGELDENGLPMLWEKRGAVAVINVSGSLVDGSSGWGRFFGVLGYDDLAVAAIAAYSDPDVKTVMWKIESPGGQVSGVIDCGTLIAQLSSMKPSMTYTGGLMASGGYWLGTSVQGQIYAGPTAEVGSIGVLVVLTDMSEAMRLAGVKKTLMRAGDDKARINPYEAPTDKALADLQQSMDDVHGLFRTQVAKGRPDLSTEELLAATTGKTFMGKRAKDAGLVDKVSSFEQALKLLDSQKPTSNTSNNSKGANMKVVLTDAQIAQISAGVAVESLGLSAEAVIEVNAEIARQAAEAKAAGDAAAEKIANATLQPTAEAVAAEAAKKAVGATETDITKLTASLHTSNIQVGLLQAQLVTANESLVTKEAELVNLKVSAQSMTANHDAMLGAVHAALGRLQVASGGSDTTAGMDAASASAAYMALLGSFNAKFKIGAASKLASGTDKVAGVEDEATRRFKAAAAAAQNNRTKT